MLDAHKARHATATVGEVELFYRESGAENAPAVLLLHGFPSSSHSFRNIMSPLAEVARVVAPDLPGSGLTQAPADYSYTFENIARTIDAFTQQIGLDRFYLYLFDFGAPVAYHLALARPDRVRGLIIQNGNAHHEGLGPNWDTAKAYWANPTPETRKALPEWMTFEGVRDEYIGGLPERLRSLVPPETWRLDWDRLSRPGLIDVQFRLFADYAQHVARFPSISAYHRTHQPPSLLMWGRHDTYFEIEEVLAYHRELDRLDMHILDGAHFLIETHHQECAALMGGFIQNTKDL